MNGLIDFHTHILPGVDDGSRSPEMTRSMLRMEAEQGVEAVAATPHFYPQTDTPERFLERRHRAEEKLRDAMADQTGLPAVHMGAEVAFYRGMSESDALQQLRLGVSRYVLVEMPAALWSDAHFEELRQIRHRQGLIPVIAHVERYLPTFGVNRIMGKLEDCGAVIQANAEFFLHRASARTAMRLLQEERIQLLGSDCHNTDSRPPNLGQAVSRIKARGGEALFQSIITNGKKIF